MTCSSMKVGFLTSLFLAIWFSHARAQTESLSLSQCLELALQNSWQVQAGDEAVRAAGAVYHAERSSYFPHVFAALSYDRLLYPQYDFRQQYGQALADWGIGDWLLRTAEVQKKNLLAEQANREQTQLDVTRRIAALYIAILQKQVNHELLANRIELLNEHAQVSNALWQAGARTQLDVLQTQSAIQQLQEEMLAAELVRDNLRQELTRLLNLPDYRALQLRALPELLIEVDSLADLRPLSLQENPLLKILALQHEAQQLRLRAVHASLLPHVQLSGGYAVDHDPTAEGNYWQVGAGLQFPLWQWGLSKFQQQEIRASASSLQFQQADLNRELQIQLKQRTEKLKKLREIYRTQQQRRDTNQKSLQLATANYQAGLITNLEYLTAQKEVTEIQWAIQQTRLDFSLTLVEMYALTNQTAAIAALQGE